MVVIVEVLSKSLFKKVREWAGFILLVVGGVLVLILWDFINSIVKMQPVLYSVGQYVIGFLYFVGFVYLWVLIGKRREKK